MPGFKATWLYGWYNKNQRLTEPLIFQLEKKEQKDVYEFVSLYYALACGASFDFSYKVGGLGCERFIWQGMRNSKV